MERWMDGWVSEWVEDKLTNTEKQRLSHEIEGDIEVYRYLFLGMHNLLRQKRMQLAYGATQICSQRRSPKEYLCRKLLILS